MTHKQVLLFSIKSVQFAGWISKSCSMYSSRTAWSACRTTNLISCASFWRYFLLIRLAFRGVGALIFAIMQVMKVFSTAKNLGVNECDTERQFWWLRTIIAAPRIWGAWSTEYVTLNHFQFLWVHSATMRVHLRHVGRKVVSKLVLSYTSNVFSICFAATQNSSLITNYAKS